MTCSKTQRYDRARVRCIRVTALSPRVDHAVTDAEMAVRNVEHRGEYRAICGAVFLPAPDCRPAQCCPFCLPYLLRQPGKRQEHSRGHRGRHARAHSWSRLWARS
jgi:hypothetical protein